MKTIISILMSVTLLGFLSAPLQAQTNPFPAGQCTAGAWELWVQWLGHSGVPSYRSAKFWWDDAQAAGYARSTSPPAWPSIMVLDGWPADPLGHVAVVLDVEQMPS